MNETMNCGMLFEMSYDEDYTQLEKAIIIATKAHAGQKTYNGEEFIMHPFEVMNKMDTIEEKTIAVLHDTVEDTVITLEYLRQEGFNENILNALDALTKREEEEYEDYIERICQNETAMKIKKADLLHNCDSQRLKGIPNEKKIKVLKRIEIKYKPALEKIESKLAKKTCMMEV